MRVVLYGTLVLGAIGWAVAERILPWSNAMAVLVGLGGSIGITVEFANATRD